MTGCKKKESFTLIEMLAVMTIMLILAGLLLPAVSKARESARRAKCISNLHQIGLALMQYANTYYQIPTWAHEEDYHPELEWAIESSNKIWGEEGPVGLGQLYTELDGVLAVLFCPGERLATDVVLNEGTSLEEQLKLATRREHALRYFPLLKKDLFSSYVYRGRAAGDKWRIQNIYNLALVMDYNVRCKKLSSAKSDPACFNHRLEAVNILYSDGAVLSITTVDRLVFVYVLDEPKVEYRWPNKDEVWQYADQQLALPR